MISYCDFQPLGEDSFRCSRCAAVRKFKQDPSKVYRVCPVGTALPAASPIIRFLLKAQPGDRLASVIDWLGLKRFVDETKCGCWNRQEAINYIWRKWVFALGKKLRLLNFS